MGYFQVLHVFLVNTEVIDVVYLYVFYIFFNPSFFFYFANLSIWIADRGSSPVDGGNAPIR